MTRLPGNIFGPLALLNVYAGCTDTVTRVPVERFDIDLYYMADKHEALSMGLSYTCHGAFCTEEEVYHFDNVFFKVGEDEARLMSPSQRVRGMKRCSVLGSSELPSESLSKRSTHQFPRLLISLSKSTFATCGTTTAEGLYANSFFELNHYAFGGRQSAGTVSACPLHFDHGVEQACSAAARVPPRSLCPGHPLRFL